MAAGRRITWLDVFTREPLSGNGLAVVHDADGLADDTLQRFARETRLSETTFVQSPTVDAADYRNRIFTVDFEMPFAGHPSLGTAVAVARERGLDEASFVQQTPAGLQPVDVRIDGAAATATMLQEPAEFGLELGPEEVLPALGLDPAAADAQLPIQVVSTGVAHVMAPVGDASALASARPDYEALARLTARTGTVVVYLAHVAVSTGQVHARSFGGSEGLGEDPATGSAAGPLCALVAARAGLGRLEISQGVEMGRRSVLRAEMEGERVRVSGDAVVLFDGTVYLDN